MSGCWKASAINSEGTLSELSANGCGDSLERLEFVPDILESSALLIMNDDRHVLARNSFNVTDGFLRHAKAGIDDTSTSLTSSGYQNRGKAMMLKYHHLLQTYHPFLTDNPKDVEFEYNQHNSLVKRL